MNEILIGINEQNEDKFLDLAMANRHGLIAGATGTGKTVTLQTLAEQFSRAGINVFAADVKGDLSGIALPGLDDPQIKQKLAKFNHVNTTPMGCPTLFWDIYGEHGHPLRTTISDLGPILLGRLLNANQTQQGIIDAAFSVADDEGLLLLDLKDIKALLTWMGENSDQLQLKYGNISKTSVAALQRGLLSLQEAGGDKLFGEPALKLESLLQHDASGNGYINILDATKLVNDPRLYSTFLLWLLSELFEQLPELGDVQKPKLIFFFDEAHLLFNSAPKVLLDKVEQVVRLIRSKGVGVYFITQNPLDVPETILGQLSNRVQHALRAFTPKDQKAVKAAATTFRQNPKLDTEQLITKLGIGEALVSFLGSDGIPSMVEKVTILPPRSKIGTITPEQRNVLIKSSPLYGQYEQAIDRESAYEYLSKKTKERQELSSSKEKTSSQKPTTYKKGASTTEVIFKNTSKILNSRIGQQIIRGILGSIFGGKKK